MEQKNPFERSKEMLLTLKGYTFFRDSKLEKPLCRSQFTFHLAEIYNNISSNRSQQSREKKFH